MFWSKTLIPTLKETPQDAESISHQLMLRAGLIRMLMAGVYSYLPLGFRVLGKIEKIIRQEMDAAGAAQLLLPALQPHDLWVRSGRDKDMGEVMIRFSDRKKRNICLGPTHEEVITELVKNHISSYRQLPMVLYQIQTKFRDEIRPRFGLVRACEFIMKDAYSFDKDEEGLDKNYMAMYSAYNSIFKRCGLDCMVIEADPGFMGGNASHEFLIRADSGEDIVWLCPQCSLAQSFHDEIDKKCPKCKGKSEKVNAIEIGHIFKLGTKYSSALGASFIDNQGTQQPIIMGCYGIGVSRMISAIIEQNHDDCGIIWPREVSPYQVIVIPLDVTDEKIMNVGLDIYAQLENQKIEVIIDDRDERAGVKFKDADLLGINLQVIIGNEFKKNGSLELKSRRTNAKNVMPQKEIIARIREALDGQAGY